MPFFFAAAVSEATRPGPPPWLSMVRPPQNLNRPSTLKACRPQIGAKRTPLPFIQRSVSRLFLTSTSDQLRVGAVFGDPVHVVEELVLGIGAEIGLGDLLLRQVGHQGLEVVDAVVDAAHGAGREAAVAACLVLRRPLQHEHRAAVLGGGQRRTQGGIAATNDHHVSRGWKHARELQFDVTGRTLHETGPALPQAACGATPCPCAGCDAIIAGLRRLCWGLIPRAAGHFS